MNKSLEYILNHWLCKKCGYVNDTYKEHRKRKELWKVCAKCSAKKPYRCI